MTPQTRIGEMSRLADHHDYSVGLRLFCGLRRDTIGKPVRLQGSLNPDRGLIMI